MRVFRGMEIGQVMNVRFAGSRNIVAFMAAVFLVPGCASRKVGEMRGSNVQAFIPEDAERHVVEKNQRFVIGEPAGQLQLPVYPWTVQVSESEASVCLEVSIDRDGVVFESKPLVAMPGCPARIGDAHPTLISSARQAVKAWRFAPSKLCIYPEGYDATFVSLKCDGPVVRVEPVPIKLAFMFKFTRKLSQNGEVSMSRLPN